MNTRIRRAQARRAQPVRSAPGEHVAVTRELTLAIRDRTILDRINLVVAAGEVLALVGPNGAGKSTLLAALAGDLPATAGDVVLFGRPAQHWAPSDLARRRALLPQHVAVSFPFTVEQVIRMGRAPWARTPAEIEDDRIVHDALDRYEVRHLRGRAYTTLSGGEQARVALARVDAQAAQLVLLDEPTAALDLHHQQLVLQHTRRLAANAAAVVVVLHDLTQAGAHADRLALLDGGRVAAFGTPRAVLTAETLTAVYRHPLLVHPHPITGTPLVLPGAHAPAHQSSTRSTAVAG